MEPLKPNPMRADAPGMAPDPGPTTVKRPRLLSPSRLNDFLGCEHRTYLDLLAEPGEIPREEHMQPDSELLLERGRRHEQASLESLRAEVRDVLSLDTQARREERAAKTGETMRAGREV